MPQPIRPQVREISCRLTALELAGRLHGRTGFFFLDSARQSGGLGRHSFLGFEPFLAFTARGDSLAITTAGRTEHRAGDPLDELRRLLRRYRSAREPRLPFCGGAVGAFGYELGRRFERIDGPAQDDLGLPDISLGFYDGVIASDRDGRCMLVANPVAGCGPEQIFRRLEEAVRAAETQPQPPPASARPTAASDQPESNFTREAYVAAIDRIRDYIAAGDVYQVNLSQRFTVAQPCPPIELYHRLRERSPAPFSCYLDLGGSQIIGSSPERFLRLQGDRLETRPIKGTRPRGADPAEDVRLRAELLASEKDRAELLMIVDLERNDLGRVCEYGSVRVDSLHELEEHPTVFHLVANISGQLRLGLDVVDCLRAAFPGGSITGAPKIRAMEIIAELEPHRRHFYTGAVGYLGFDGGCDLNVAIRTILCTGGKAHYFVGGGIVWDSNAKAEYQETLDKGVAMRDALLGIPGSAPRAARGLFETIKVVNGKPVFIAEHCARLARSAQALGFRPAPAASDLRARCAALVSEHGTANSVLRVTLDDTGAATLTLTPPRYPAEHLARGFRLRTFPVPAAFSAHKLLARPLLEEARGAARAAGADDALLVDGGGRLLEASVSNVFVVRCGRVLTPPLQSGILPGVVRALLLAAPGLPAVEETDLTQPLLAEADEVFVTNSLVGVMPVAQVDGRRFDLANNPVTRTFQAAYARLEAADVRF